MRAIALIAALAVAGCDITTTPAPLPSAPPPSQPVGPRLSAAEAAANFRAIVTRIEPVAEQVCRERTRNLNCDFRIVVDDRPNQPPNAFQTLDENRRPIVGFTIALIQEARNRDELAFVMGHETAHHIAGHIPQTQQRAVEGAVLGTVLATVLGLDASGVDAAQRVGSTVGARRYAKEFELEADALGTVISHRAGYDPVRGAAFFSRIPDPGDRFLGTHPPNADRIATVRRVAAGL